MVNVLDASCPPLNCAKLGTSRIFAIARVRTIISPIAKLSNGTYHSCRNRCGINVFIALITSWAGRSRPSAATCYVGAIVHSAVVEQNLLQLKQELKYFLQTSGFTHARKPQVNGVPTDASRLIGLPSTVS